VARPLFRGDRLRGAREAAGLSRADLALALGLSSPSRIRVWESGIEHPRPRFVPTLATVLGVEPLQLLDADPDDPPLIALRMAAGRATTEMHTPVMSVMTYVRLEDGRPGAEPADAVIAAIAAVLHVAEAQVLSAVRRSRRDHAGATPQSS
jgi:DNA-binding XRE family transcriptional regulator